MQLFLTKFKGSNARLLAVDFMTRHRGLGWYREIDNVEVYSFCRDDAHIMSVAVA